jgi:hypothetical protein
MTKASISPVMQFLSLQRQHPPSDKAKSIKVFVVGFLVWFGFLTNIFNPKKKILSG